MLWILLLVSQCAFGFTFTRFVLKSYVDLIVEFIIGIPFGLAFSSFIFYFLSSVLAISTFHIFIHIALLLAVSFVLIVFNGIKNFKSELISFKPNKITILFLIISFITSAAIVFPQYYIDLPQISKSFHFEFNEEYTLMKSFYVGCNSGFTNPFKIRHPYCYKCLTKSHWLTALHSAMLLTSFSSEKVAITIPSFLLFFQFCFLYLYFSRVTILKNSIYSILSLFVFLFAGGFGFIRWFWRDPRRDISNDFVYIWSLDKQTFWSHPILQYLLAYRPSFLSLSLIIDISFLLYKVIYVQNCQKGSEKKIVNDDFSNPTNYTFKLSNLSIISAFAGMLYGLTIPTQIEVTISFSFYLAVFFFFLFLIKGKFDHHLISLLSFVIGFASIFIPQIFILLRWRNCDQPIFSMVKFWLPLTVSGRFYGQIVIWFEALGVFSVMTVVVVWIHLLYVAFLSSSQSPKLKEAAIYVLKFYLPPFSSFLFINMVQFHGESRQNILAFYPCWMIYSSMIFICTFDSIVKSVKPTVRAVSSSKKRDSSSSENDEDFQVDDENRLKNKIESELIVNVHLRSGNRAEDARVEEIQGILIGWFIFFYVITVASAMIGFHRLRSRRAYVYSTIDERLAEWIVLNTNIKDLFYVDPGFSNGDYSPVYSLAGRVVVQDPALCPFYRPNNFISAERSRDLKISQKLTRAGFVQDRLYQSEVFNLTQNLESKIMIPKLKYVINWKNSNPKFNFTPMPENWKLAYDNGNILIYERLKTNKKKK